MSSKNKKIATPPSSDDEEDQIVVAPEPIKVKSKKDRTPAQKESFTKALTILKEKRESKARDQSERLAKASAEEKALMDKEKYEKAKNHKKKLPPAPSYVTMSDLDRFKNDILGAIQTSKPSVEKVVDKPVIKEIKETPTIVKPVVEKIVSKTLTGHDLLDKLFFS